MHFDMNIEFDKSCYRDSEAYTTVVCYRLFYKILSEYHQNLLVLNLIIC